MNRQYSNSLRSRLVLQIGMMIVGLLLLSVAAVVGINGLHQDFGDALRGYQRLRGIYEMGLNVATARSALRAQPQDDVTAHAAIQAAILKLDTDTGINDASLRASLQRAADSKEPESLDTATARLAGLSAGIRTSIITVEQAANRKRQITLTSVLTLGVAVVAAGILVGFRQYRGVMNPLRALGIGVRHVASGNFQHPITAGDDREFATLARNFNRMAAELDGLYRDLERKVQIKSKELVRSERLASIGFLAAGVAHEINNPLSIITGYGERAIQHLDRDFDDTGRERARKAIAVICEEAFRCKQITDRLLSLARPGSDDRTDVCLPVIADEVISNVGNLPEYRDRRIILETGPRDGLLVNAKDGEMKQVILNLLINALEAMEGGSGLVRIAITRVRDEIELAVIDNGRGMSESTLEHAFEPFFTHKRTGRHGTGLGLSITHAIVMDHGGTIRAESDGPGRGSRFVVRLPAAREGAGHVNG